MKTNKENWEEKLKKELGDDANHFLLPENYFESLKNEIKFKIKDEVSALAEASADEQTPRHPEQTLRHPEQTLRHPEQTLRHPEQTLRHPEQTLRHPELAEGPIPLLKWVYIAALPIAAALTFFVLNRETATQPETLDQTLMSEAAEGFYESKVEEAPLLEIDSQTIAELQESEALENIKEEVLIEEYELAALEEEEDDDLFSDLDLEDIEQYLAENININSEL